MSQASHSRDLRRCRLTDISDTFFVTKCLHPKKPVLDPKAREVIVSAFEFAVVTQRIHLRAFVVMPDHFHGLFALQHPWTLPRFMHGMMSYVAAKTSRRLRTYSTEWQDSYYETWIRTARQFAYVQSYIENNPVTKALVENPEQWAASSANRTDLTTQDWPWSFHD
jgi:REP element-mobilizing transposase RayT